MPEVVYLLGAGASADAGLPIASQLTSRALELIDSTPSDHSVAGDALKFVIATVRRDALRDGASPKDMPDIEAVVGAAQLLARRDRLEVAPFIEAWNPMVEILTNKRRNRDTFDHLYYTLVRMLRVELLIPLPHRLSYLAPLVRQGQDGRTVIATLNYDLSIETAAQHLDVPLALGTETWNREWRLTFLESGINLIKLHGSIDWDRWANSVTDSDMKRTDMTPLVLYGARDKLRSEGPFLELRAAFQAELRVSRYLVVVGYSFRDRHVNELIENWLARVRDSKLIVVDPGFPEHLNYAIPPWDFRSILADRLQERKRDVVASSRIAVIREGAAAALPRVCRDTEQLDKLVESTIGGTPIISV
jgi:hypothetical protein